MHFESVGDPHDPAVVFLHGLSHFGLVWAPQLEVAVHSGWRAVTVDLRGRGLSEPVTTKRTVTELAADVLALLDALGVREAVFCGLSLGSMIAQQLLVDHPDRVRGAILAGIGTNFTFPGAREMVDGWIALWLSENGPLTRLETTWPFVTTEAFRESAPGRALYASWRRALAPVDGRSLAHIAEGLLEFDVRPGLPGVDQPVLVVAGEHDRLAPPPMVREVADLIPGAQFEIIEGAGHISNRERPDRFNDLLLAFLAGRAGRGS